MMIQISCLTPQDGSNWEAGFDRSAAKSGREQCRHHVLEYAEKWLRHFFKQIICTEL